MLRYLSFDLSDNADGVCTLEALASTGAAQHAAVLAEVQQVLDWAWRHSPHGHGPVEDGGEWLHDLQVQAEAGGWHSVVLTLSASEAFAQAFLAAWGAADDTGH
ncbi:MAG: hypothetical protein ACK5QH_10990 [Rubrivivax sp.]|jgi:hypothetical protein